MSIYTVHMKGSPDEPSAFERAVFVREGFGWWAFLLGPAWLLWNRAWIALLAWIAFHIALGWMVQAQILHMGAQSMLELLMALALGFEAGTIRRYVLRRRGFQIVDIIQERRLADAERRFFARVIPTHDRVVPPRVAMNAGSASLVGLFPSAGA